MSVQGFAAIVRVCLGFGRMLDVKGGLKEVCTYIRPNRFFYQKHSGHRGFPYRILAQRLLRIFIIWDAVDLYVRVFPVTQAGVPDDYVWWDHNGKRFGGGGLTNS